MEGRHKRMQVTVKTIKRVTGNDTPCDVRWIKREESKGRVDWETVKGSKD